MKFIGTVAAAPSGVFALAMATLCIVAPTPSRAELKDVYKAAYTQHVCERDPRGSLVLLCHDVFHPAIPNAGWCTRVFVEWSKGSAAHDDDVTVCLDFMGVNKFCADQDMYAGSRENPDGRLAIVCKPHYHHDSIDEQFVHIWTGIGEGLLTAAPFVAEGVLGVTCLYGQVYACAVLALEISDQAGVRIPSEVGDAIYIANKAPQCIDGDAVACAYLGARGAKAVGLEIPGIPALKIFEDQQKCTDGDFAACVRLGKEAADAGGIETGSLTGSLIDGQACLDGNKDTCWKLAKEAIQDHVPLNGVASAAEDARTCDAGDRRACERLGYKLSAVAAGLNVVLVESAPFGANACVSSAIPKGPVDLASMWQDQHATSVAVFPSDGSRFGTPTRPSTRDGGWAETAKWAAADFNGDGVTDLLAAWDDNGSNTLTVRQSNGARLTPVHWAIRAGTWVDTTVWLPGDFNGDGRMDVAGVWNDGSQTSIAVYLSDGTRFTAPTQWSVRDGGWSDDVKWAVGDFNGDGKADIAAVWNNGGNNTITVRQSTGSGFAAAHWSTNAGGWIASTTWLAGDFNGDGRLDLAAAWHDGNAVSIAVYASDGHSFPGWNQWSSRDGGWIDNARWVAGDFNGDGKADVAAIWNNGGSNTLTVRQSTGTGFVPVHWATNAGGWSPTAAWCSGRFPTPQQFAELASKHSAAAALFEPAPTVAGTVAESDQGISSTTALAQSTTVKALGRVRTDGAPATSHLTICEAAYGARARNSPAAPGLERQCAASGGSPVPPLDPAMVEALAVVGAQIAQADPDVAAARTLVANADYRHGFDIATGIFGDPAQGAKGNTLMGPGSARIRDSLPADGQNGFTDSVTFHLARDYRH